ncbi:DUF3793 family protein [Coprococcus sp. AF21-14LB]|uniref:DUF3793 family protein n=1 Tax=Coprococcus sp. AF21-14LB TaxID=2292231 RepID=UPI000E493949|nr:DUF3793 family protein [Coprococcus sp. AF21-14LB]QUO30798.1 DUF3793 family protein [Faecalicatena sp. Marseille-Q4148]RGS80122.1 DUF3793 family protein [Coprococcus sp. AF21-14LB]
MFEKYLITYCSPTLASLKSANLFTVKYVSESELCLQLDVWNAHFRSKGLCLMVLRRQEHTALIYIYRHSLLSKELKKPGVAAFLAGYGYESTEFPYVLEHLKARIEQSGSFPHEIGVFLGYPLADVIGFIENAGQNSKCSGCWKVYCNECEAIRTFARFKKCKEVYERLWRQGRSVMKLTVAA